MKRLPANITRILLFSLSAVLSGCSVYMTRFYSHPEYKASAFVRNESHFRLNPRLEHFSASQLSDTYIDTLDGVVIQIRLKNEQSRLIFGPPFVPLISVWDDYGANDDTKPQKQSKNRNAVDLTVLISIETSERTDISFDVSKLRIQKRQGTDAGKQIEIARFYKDSCEVASPIVSIKTIQGQKLSWELVFSGSVYPDEEPILWLNSFQINHRPAYTHGIPFKLKKANFYSALISING